jgi:CheY-like chemotaxis protein
MREHRGHLLVHTSPAGTTFEAYVPETPEPEQISVTKLNALPAMRGSESILIVEEDDVLRKMIAGILATDGYSVTAATNPRTAAATLKATGLRPQLVLIQSCTRDGAELVRRLHAANPALRLVCTAPKAPAVIPHTVPASSVAHLPKPFALSTLLVKARALLDTVGR